MVKNYNLNGIIWFGVLLHKSIKKISEISQIELESKLIGISYNKNYQFRIFNDSI